jgi:hypothetical protein
MTRHAVSVDLVVNVLLSLVTGMVGSILFWWLQFRVFRVRRAVSEKLARNRARSEPRLQVKIRNTGRRDVIDLSVIIRIRLPGVAIAGIVEVIDRMALLNTPHGRVHRTSCRTEAQVATRTHEGRRMGLMLMPLVALFRREGTCRTVGGPSGRRTFGARQSRQHGGHRASMGRTGSELPLLGGTGRLPRSRPSMAEIVANALYWAKSCVVATTAKIDLEKSQFGVNAWLITSITDRAKYDCYACFESRVGSG